MIVEIISTGTELLLGQIVNTNAAFLSRRLNDLGFDVLYQSTVGDNRERMREVLQHAVSRADLVITSGGLGPTQGDITKDVIADLCRRPLQLDEDSMERIAAYFTRRGVPMAQSNQRQAMLPQGSFALVNEVGTAPGIALEHGGKWIVSLPGPPHELEHMVIRQLEPFLSRTFSSQGCIRSSVLHTYGIGESLLEEKIMDLILAQQNPTLALLARGGEIVLRLTAKAESEEQAETLLQQLEDRLRERIGQHVWGCGEQNVEQVLGAQLAASGATIAFAESCTGGLASHLLTNIAGSSCYLKGSLICYSEDSKKRHLSVDPAAIETQGVVSPAVAQQMAAGAWKMFAADIGVGITGWAGPAAPGDAPDKTGTVVIAVADSNGRERCETFSFRAGRQEVKARAAKAALHMVREFINTNERKQ